MPLRYVTVADRPDLIPAMWALPSPWPQFMLHDLVGDVCYDLLPQRYPEHQLLVLDGDGAAERVLAKLNAVPFAWSGRDEDLPPTGWEFALSMAFRPEMPAAATAVCLVEARMHPDAAGRGLSAGLLEAGRANARRLGYAHLLAPIRPTRKHREPHTPMAEYVARTREDGAAWDPWLRTHLRLGGRLVGICPCAMTIAGDLAQWRHWTGLPFDASGEVVVDGALNPVHVSRENDYAVYVEPNLWIAHSTASAVSSVRSGSA